MHPPQLMPGTDRSVCRRPASISRLARRSSSDDNRVRADTPVTASPNRAIGVPSRMAQPRENDDETNNTGREQYEEQGKNEGRTQQWKGVEGGKQVSVRDVHGGRHDL